MVRFLLHRPIGTCVVALTLTALGIIAATLLPVSLLPDIPVPEITVQVRYPNADARQMQQVVTLPLRNQLLQINHLEDMEAISQDGQAIIKMRFDYGTDVDLAYLETNEKIDALMNWLPADLERPRVLKAGAGDVPVFQLNVYPAGDSSDLLQVSEFCENVLKRRIEQLPEIALVDMTGQARPEVVIRPDRGKLHAIGLTETDLAAALGSRMVESGNITVREGHYEYSIRMGGRLNTRQDILETYLTVGKESRRLVRLGDLATVSMEERPQAGLHTFDGQRAIGMAVIKRSDAQLLQLRDHLYEQVRLFRQEYPSLRFEISQDQTELLHLSINNLIGSLLGGAVLTFVMIFFFMSDRRVPGIIGLVIPVSLSVTMLAFYLLGLSINIISLAGLVLGIGEVIDSAIIMIENIEDHRKGGASIAEASSRGAGEVIRPLFTSVLTNSLVFLPLLFLSGIAGALFYDQAVAVSLILGVSLLSSYTLVPVLYHLLCGRQEARHLRVTPAQRKVDWLYKRVFRFSFRYPGLMVFCWLLLLAGAALTGYVIPKSGMPDLSRTELEVFVDWNEPVNPEENRSRLDNLLGGLPIHPLKRNLYVGSQQFLLNTRLQMAPSEALLVMKVQDEQQYNRATEAIGRAFREKYAAATVTFRPALNVFEQLFRSDEAALRMQLFNSRSQQPPDYQSVNQVLNNLRQAGFQVQPPPERQRIVLHVHQERLALYRVEVEGLLKVLQALFNENNIGVLRTDQQQIPILLAAGTGVDLSSKLKTATVSNRSGQSLPVSALLTYKVEKDYASLMLGRQGAYVSLSPTKAMEPIAGQQQAIRQAAGRVPSVAVDFTGSYLRYQQYLDELFGVVVVAIVMLFFILAAQFESLLQPFIVLLTIVFGATGALVALYFTGGSLNIMSAIGLIVLMGLLDNDSILKIDTMNRSRENLSLMECINEGGRRRLKSQMITYLTTVLGLLPILWTSGLGAELQKPLAVSVIGGMTLGVLISWTFIPLTYYLIYNRRQQVLKPV